MSLFTGTCNTHMCIYVQGFILWFENKTRGVKGCSRVGQKGRKREGTGMVDHSFRQMRFAERIIIIWSVQICYLGERYSCKSVHISTRRKIERDRQTQDRYAELEMTAKKEQRDRSKEKDITKFLFLKTDAP